MLIRSLLVLLLSITAAWAQPFTGNIPLPTLGDDTYLGFQGGLYPEGSNAIPPSHAEAARNAAEQIMPRDREGNPDPAGGLTGFITIGMSNATQEFKVFERFIDLRHRRHPRAVLVNTAQAGQAADVISDSTAGYWQLVMEKLTAAGLSPNQVQVVWIKQAQAQPDLQFPDHALDLKENLAAVVRIAQDLFPNLKLAFLSSRIYGGYSNNPLRGEPLSYETGFAVKWLIEDQINGVPGFNEDAAAGPVDAPVLLWGPYLWADGINQSESGLRWREEDFESDGVHPSLRGELKVGRMLAGFFHRHRDHVRPWIDALPDRWVYPIFAGDDANVDEQVPDGNFGGLPFLSVGTDERSIYLRIDASRIPRARVLHAKLSLRSLPQSSVTVAIDSATDSNWNEHNITWSNAPVATGQVVSEGVAWSRDSSPSFDVTEVLKNDDDGIITLVLQRDESPNQELAAKENWNGGRPALFVSYAGPDRPEKMFNGNFELAY